MNVGPIIRQLRKEKGISQGEFGKAVHLSQTTLSQIETGTRKPQKATLEAICKELEIPEQLLIVLSMEHDDIPAEKKEMFELLFPMVKELMFKIYYQDDNTPITIK